MVGESRFAQNSMNCESVMSIGIEHTPPGLNMRSCTTNVPYLGNKEEQSPEEDQDPRQEVAKKQTIQTKVRGIFRMSPKCILFI